MKRILLALMTFGFVLFGAPMASASGCTTECQIGYHSACPYAVDDTEEFDCECPCHDALFELKRMELGL